MKWIALLCVIVTVSVLYGQCTSSFPRGDNKWSQGMYDRQLAFCVAAYSDSAICNCAVSATEEALPFERALILEDNSPAVNDAAKNPVFGSVKQGVAWCRTPEGRKNNPVRFDPHAGKGGVVNAGDQKRNNGVTHRVKYDPKTGTWSN